MYLFIIYNPHNILFEYNFNLKEEPPKRFLDLHLTPSIPTFFGLLLPGLFLIFFYPTRDYTRLHLDFHIFLYFFRFPRFTYTNVSFHIVSLTAFTH